MIVIPPRYPSDKGRWRNIIDDAVTVREDIKITNRVVHDSCCQEEWIIAERKALNCTSGPFLNCTYRSFSGMNMGVFINYIHRHWEMWFKAIEFKICIDVFNIETICTDNIAFFRLSNSLSGIVAIVLNPIFSDIV